MRIEGGCERCGMFTYNNMNGEEKPSFEDKLICQNCHKKYYSEEAIRDVKLKKLLKRSIWSKIKEFFIL
jgi:hypothetical protein